MKKKIEKRQIISAGLVLMIGFFMVMALFFWYKMFAKYNHVIYMYEVEEFIEESENGTREMIESILYVNRYYETAIYNHSAKDITVDIYDNTEEQSLVLLQGNVRIAGGEEYRFRDNKNAYKIIVHGEDITEENIIIEASSVSYLKTYRTSVIITMLIAIAMVGIWGLLILFAPKFVEGRGENINNNIAKISAIASVFSCIIFSRGYFESNLCFIALLCALLSLIMKKKENEKEAVL